MNKGTYEVNLKSWKISKAELDKDWHDALPLKRRWFTLKSRYMTHTPEVEKYMEYVTDQIHKILPTPEEAYRKYMLGEWPPEILTRGEEKGNNMRPDLVMEQDTCYAEKPMSLQRHKKINELAYELKAVMDKKIPDLKNHELCMLGEIMQRIGQLK